MNKIPIIISILLISTYAYAGTFVFHTGETITGKRSSCGAVCSSRPDALRIDLAVYNSITQFHKVVGNAVIEMTQVEKDAILQAEADAKDQAILDAIDKFEVTNIDLITALIKRINVRIPGNIITKKEIIDQIKSDKGITP